jgi:hypothetical protein
VHGRSPAAASEFGRYVVLGNRLRPLRVDHATEGTAITNAMAQGHAIGGVTMRVTGEVSTRPAHHLHWAWWRRRHQARARWYHQRTRLGRELNQLAA